MRPQVSPRLSVCFHFCVWDPHRCVARAREIRQNRSSSRVATVSQRLRPPRLDTTRALRAAVRLAPARRLDAVLWRGSSSWHPVALVDNDPRTGMKRRRAEATGPRRQLDGTEAIQSPRRQRCVVVDGERGWPAHGLRGRGARARSRSPARTGARCRGCVWPPVWPPSWSRARRSPRPSSG
jgi:hypothetical protein